MKNNLHKYIIIFFTFSSCIFLTLYTFKTFVPKEVIPEIYPENKENKIITTLPSGEKKLEIYNIVSPNSEIKKEINNEMKEETINVEIKKNSLNFELQLGALKDRKKAKTLYQKIVSDFPEYFKVNTPIIEEVNIVDNGIFFRVKSFESFSRKQANEICQVLRLKKHGCIVTKLKKKNND